jgi:hypothetical protein
MFQGTTYGRKLSRVYAYGAACAILQLVQMCNAYLLPFRRFGTTRAVPFRLVPSFNCHRGVVETA